MRSPPAATRRSPKKCSSRSQRFTKSKRPSAGRTPKHDAESARPRAGYPSGEAFNYPQSSAFGEERLMPIEIICDSVRDAELAGAS